jgi:hypothetical protein
VVNAKPRPLYPGKQTRYPLYRRLGGSQDRSGWMRKISPPTGIRSTDRPARSESPYRLRYSGPLLLILSFLYLHFFFTFSSSLFLLLLPTPIACSPSNDVCCRQLSAYAYIRNVHVFELRDILGFFCLMY